MNRIFWITAGLLILSLFGLFACEKSEVRNTGLKDKEWEVVSIIESGSALPEQAENAYVMNFTNDTTYTLSLDVNNCSGSYRVKSGSKIEFSGAACTMVCCDSEYATTLVGLLPGITDYRFEAGYLILLGEGRIKLK